MNIPEVLATAGAALVSLGSAWLAWRLLRRGLHALALVSLLATLGAGGYVALSLVLWSAFSGQCADTIVAATPAPGGQRSAVLFERNCGATTDFSTQVSVVQAGRRPSGGGNVFVAAADHDRAARAAWGGPWAQAAWRSPTHLVVRYDANAQVFKRTAEADGVTITFEPVSAPLPFRGAPQP